MNDDLKAEELKNIEARALRMFKNKDTGRGLKAGLKKLVESCARVSAQLSVQETKSALSD